MFAPRCHEQLVALGGCLNEHRDFRRVEYAPWVVVDLWGFSSRSSPFTGLAASSPRRTARARRLRGRRWRRAKRRLGAAAAGRACCKRPRSSSVARYFFFLAMWSSITTSRGLVRLFVVPTNLWQTMAFIFRSGGVPIIGQGSGVKLSGQPFGSPAGPLSTASVVSSVSVLVVSSQVRS